MAAVALQACSSSQTGESTEQLTETSVKSPDGNITVNFNITEDGSALYNIQKQGTEVLESSRLGVVREDADFTQNLSLVSASAVEPVTDNYTMLHGKQKEFSYRANEKVFRLKNASGEEMDVIFQVSDGGVAFRYYFPAQSQEVKKIKEEVTSFNLPDDARAWLQPFADAKTGWAQTNPSYEENYLQDIAVGTPSPFKAGWVYPALFKKGDTWVLISETGLDRNYAATRLQQQSPGGEYKVGFPQPQEVMAAGELNPESQLPWYSPWRIMAIGDLETITESTLGTDLAIPAIDMNTDWVKPGRSSWSWVLLKDENTVYDVQKQFIDYAADMGWEYTLIDAEWDKQIGYDKIQELVDYGKEKGVGIILWYNSAGNWNTTHQTPKDLMVTKESRLKEFKRIAAMGVKGVKVDFFGGDGQSVIQFYHDILKDAAEAKIMVNFHGTTLPRGWSRTYPHLLTAEAIKGMEFATFEQRNADVVPNHSAMLPFTRNVYDPMDFTPTAFSETPNLKRVTSNAFELALPVIFTSGVQHYAEVPAGMAAVPDYVQQLMRDYPVSWDETQYVAGFPGKEAVIARRSGDTWYVAGINGEATDKQMSLKLPFIKAKTGELITDGENNRSFNKTEVKLEGDNTLNVPLKANGGFVLKFKQG